MKISMRHKLVSVGMMSLLAACDGSSTAVSSSPAQPDKGERETAVFTVNLYGISFDGMPIDLAGVKQLDLCSHARCHPVQLHQTNKKTVTNDAAGGAMLIGSVQLPALDVTRVRLTAQGNIGVNATEAVLAQPLKLDGDASVPARVLVSLSANWSCGKAECLVLRGGAAGLREDGPGQYLAYNPNNPLSVKMPESVGLVIPAGALPGVQLFRVNVMASSPQARVDIQPSLKLEAPAILSVPPGPGLPAQRQLITTTGDAVSGTVLPN